MSDVENTRVDIQCPDCEQVFATWWLEKPSSGSTETWTKLCDCRTDRIMMIYTDRFGLTQLL